MAYRLIKQYGGHEGHGSSNHPDKYVVTVADTLDDARYLRGLVKQFISHVEFFHSRWMRIRSTIRPPGTQGHWKGKDTTATLSCERKYLERLIEEAMRQTIKNFWTEHQNRKTGNNSVNACRRQEYMLYLVLNCLADLRVINDASLVKSLGEAKFVQSSKYYTGIHRQYEPSLYENMLITLHVDDADWFPVYEDIHWKLPIHFTSLAYELDGRREMSVFNLRRRLERYAMYLCFVLTYPGAHPLYFSSKYNLDPVAVLDKDNVLAKDWKPMSQLVRCGYPDYPILDRMTFCSLPLDNSEPMSLQEWYEFIRQDRIQDLQHVRKGNRKEVFSRMM